MTDSDGTAVRTIYKIASREVFEASVAADRFIGMPIDHQDGYIHLSTASQLSETLQLYFAGQADIVLFAVPADAVPVTWEPSRGGQLFPHIYGELPMAVIGPQAVIAVAADGAVALPEWVK